MAELDIPEVSCIRPSEDHNQSSRVERVLFGPIRFLNHICGNPNTEVRFTLCYFKLCQLIIIQFIAISGSSGFFAFATQDILAGEELFVDYGNEWFVDEPGGVPVQTCKPNHQIQKRQFGEKDMETVIAEKRMPGK